MTITEVVSILKLEKQNNVPCRFPCRIIAVRNIAQYCELLSELKKISGMRVIRSEEVVKARDGLPVYSKLENDIYRDEWLILTGAGEYLRLFMQDEASEKRFYYLWKMQFSGTSTGRIIIPLWGIDMQWIEAALQLKDSRQQDFCFDCTDYSLPEQKMSISVYSDMFKTVPKKESEVLFNGLREMFTYWQDPLPSQKNFILITKQHGKIPRISGDVNICVTDDMLTYLHEHMRGGEYLTADNCPGDMQQTLYDYANEGATLDEAILKIFNVSSFSAQDIMGKWNAMPSQTKQFVVLWYNLHPDTSYLNHCINISPSADEIPYTVSHEIFNVMDEKPAWVDEFGRLVSVMNIRPDAKYFEALDGIADYEQRLTFLTAATREERIYMLKLAGKSCASADSAAVMEKIKGIYPALAAYLTDEDNVYPDGVGAYMQRYKMHKLANTLPDDEGAYFDGVDVETFDKRYSVLHRYEDSGTVFLWIDALGAEWLPLLYCGLKGMGSAAVTCEGLVQANLPTETCYNSQWQNMPNNHDKLDKLDKLAHKGVIDEPNYYSCVEEQIAFVYETIRKKVAELLESYRRVVITGDHGTSRLAARFFHCREGIAAPNGATVCSFGRFCKLEQGGAYHYANVKLCETSEGKFAVYSNYDHFKQSGNASGGSGEEAIYGEVHGGAAPEEVLVPVIVVESTAPVPLTGEFENTTVKIKNRRAAFTITFNKKVQNLTAKIKGTKGAAAMIDDGKKWNVSFANVKHGSYRVEVCADGHIVDLQEVTIKPAMGGGDGDLP